jgi:hypothetical protein
MQSSMQQSLAATLVPPRLLVRLWLLRIRAYGWPAAEKSYMPDTT